ncbi:threonine-phosphate decarboxylase CobD [Luteibacter sp. dw_328]|uniref:threonine-phosphate decarboxylase CobD n=1 Tax=Luteibacter sp. dw_328 TaxID=2719796 RepID=UPI001BD24D5E|nr:threonine-phosphate decarboxylase CobD [Luteibacter sp. dw_328]
MLEHGGRLGRAVREYGIAREHWLDLSTGVSPFAYPLPTVPSTVWQRLPEDDDELLDAARGYYGTGNLLPVAGSQAAIAALPRLRGRSRVAVVEPAYAEHAHAWLTAGHDVVTLPFHALLARAHEFDVVVVIRPNNPTGERADRETLLELHDRLARREAAPGLARQRPWLVVDEAFIDVSPEDSLCGHRRDGLIVLRSVGKFFGLAGARAGFVAAWPALLDDMAASLGPWTLTGPTRYVVARALKDTAWQASAREWLRRASAQLASLLTEHGLPPSGGCEFFHYCEHPDAATLHRALAQRGILVRHFDNPQALRFGLPADEASFVVLGQALSEAIA